MTLRDSIPTSEQPHRPEAHERGESFVFRDRSDAEQYLAWKSTVPQEVRNIVEGTMQCAPMPELFTPLPFTNQFLRGLASGLHDVALLETLSDIDPRVRELLLPLSNIKTKEGFLNTFAALVDPELSWSFRKNLYDLQVKPIVEWLVSQDMEAMRAHVEKQQAEEEPTEEQERAQPVPEDDVPPSSENVRSSMESGTEKREGAPKALFTVRPFYGGYYKQFAFDCFDPTTLQWGKSEHAFHEPESSDLTAIGRRVLHGKVRRGTPLALPMPYDWACDPTTLESSDPSATLVQNQDGQWYLATEGDGIGSYALTIEKTNYRKESGSVNTDACAIEGALPADVQQQIAETRVSALQPMARARHLVRAVRDHLEYANDAVAYATYMKNPQKFFEKIWEMKKADCHVANTIAARVLTEAGMLCRFIGGHFVKEKGEDDAAILHAGSGHAWIEVFDSIGRRWVRLDSTPKGDPTIDEDAQEQDLSGEGDFGENEREIASEQEAKKQVREFERKEGAGGSGRRESPWSTAEERFAEMGECTEAQAREYLRALERVREIKDEHGMPIVERLIEEWKKIVQEYVIETSDYRGPVRMDDGDRLDDPVSAKIDIVSGEYNPTGFEKETRVEKIEADFGGLNIYFSFDLSGSMTEADAASGRSKADVQRDIALLFADSLTQCAFVARQMASRDVSVPLKMMVTVASSRGRVQLPLTDRWTPKEQWAFYSALAQCASGGTPIHETLALIEKAFDAESAELKKKHVSIEKQPIHYVAEISDGVPDSIQPVVAHHASMKQKGMAVRAYIVGEKAPAEYGGDAAEPVESFTQLPQMLARDIISVFKKLKPRRIKPS